MTSPNNPTPPIPGFIAHTSPPSADALGIVRTGSLLAVPQAIHDLALEIGARNCEHLVTALRAYPAAFHHVVGLPWAQFMPAHAAAVSFIETFLRVPQKKLLNLSEQLA